MSTPFPSRGDDGSDNGPFRSSLRDLLAIRPTNPLRSSEETVRLLSRYFFGG
jgi:hypothetical protein